MKWLESELAKVRADAETWLSSEKTKYEEKVDAGKAVVVKAFRSLIEFGDIKVEYGLTSYL